MMDFTIGAEITRPLGPAGAKQLDRDLLERQTRALEVIAAQLQALARPRLGEMPLELQPQYVLAKKRLL